MPVTTTCTNICSLKHSFSASGSQLSTHTPPLDIKMGLPVSKRSSKELLPWSLLYTVLKANTSTTAVLHRNRMCERVGKRAVWARTQWWPVHKAWVVKRLIRFSERKRFTEDRCRCCCGENVHSPLVIEWINYGLSETVMLRKWS